MVTTIQVSDQLKLKLAEAKKNLTYEQFIQQLLRKHHKQIITDKMIEYGKKHAKKEQQELAEWKETELPWK